MSVIAVYGDAVRGGGCGSLCYKRLIAVIGMLALATQAEPCKAVVEADGGKLSVAFCRPDVVHVRFVPKGDAFADPNVAVRLQSVVKTDADYPPVAVTRHDASGFVELSSDSLSIRVDRNTLGLAVRDGGGRLVFESGAVPFAADGSRRTAAFRRDVAARERFFGLGNYPGQRFKALDHRDNVYELWMSDDNVHAIVPLWYSTAGYGIFVNDAHRGRVSFKEDYGLTLDGGQIDFYFLWGPSFRRILTNWSELAGRMNMPPLYALGLTWRSWGRSDAAKILECAKRQLDAGVKMDVCGVEPGWQTMTYPCSFVWQTAKFPDPRAFMAAVHDMGLRVNLWEHPYLHAKSPLLGDMLQYGRWGTSMSAGPDLHGCKYGFSGFIPDMSDPAAQERYWKYHLDNIVSLGADGFKVDETDQFGANDSLEPFKSPSGIDCNAYHNLIGTLTCNAMHLRYKRDLGRRSFFFSRGNYAGMQRWATAAYTDFYGFPQFVMSMVVQGYSGSYYTPEIRSVGTKSDLDYMRRIQLMFLSPFPQSNEWAGKKGPMYILDRNQEVIDCYRKYNALHYALVPYMYSLFWEQHNTGVGVVRPLPIEFPEDGKSLDDCSSFMLGPSLLVRPVAWSGTTNRVETVSVYLPSGADWIDYNTGAVHGGGQTLDYASPIETLPLFVRAGAIIPVGRYGTGTARPLDGAVRLHVFPARGESSFTLYEDDGISFAYENGDYAETPVSCREDGGAMHVAVGPRRGRRKIAVRPCEVVVHCRKEPSAVTLGGKPVGKGRDSAVRWWFEEGKGTFDRATHVVFTDDGTSREVVLR